jgi:hypothetical protein
MSDPDPSETDPVDLRPRGWGGPLDRRALLRLAGVSALGLAVGGCAAAGSEPGRCAADLDEGRLRTIVRDGFDRPDGPIGLTETGEAWEESAGTWSVVSGHARAVPEFAAQVCTAEEMAFSAAG